MIDYFTIALTHGLIAIAAWRLLFRDDLDSDRADERDDSAPPTGAAENCKSGSTG